MIYILKALKLALLSIIMGHSVLPSSQFTVEEESGIYPRVFQDNYFQGRSRTISQSHQNLHFYQLGDEISSCSVPPGWKLVFYEHKDFCGATFTVTSNEPDFSHYRDWNDRVSSVKVYYNGRIQGAAFSCTDNKCPRCQGDGERYETKDWGPIPCNLCNGTGRYFSNY
ncbi:MAG: beta/gamma crystallin-related protein [Lewinella sp.]|uniref:beta/gamma crystallin-related protein n=1 Tax=Lewinella sp. TaxID=2004506 RepID=UPI003D6A4779